MRRDLLRMVSLYMLSLWIGGFTFYSAAVIPVLHEQMESYEAGAITQKVTDRLNALGALTLILVCATTLLGVAQDAARFRKEYLFLVTTSGAILIYLVILHRSMDHRLNTVGLAGFYRLHRAYLIASTAHWVINVAILGLLYRWPAIGRSTHGSPG